MEGVADERWHSAPDPALPLASPAQLRAALAQVAAKRALAVLLVDLTDASGGFLSRVRDLIGRNHVLLLGTKVATIRKERRGRDVYVRGAANVGKSAFVRSSRVLDMNKSFLSGSRPLMPPRIQAGVFEVARLLKFRAHITYQQ